MIFRLNTPAVRKFRKTISLLSFLPAFYFLLSTLYFPLPLYALDIPSEFAKTEKPLEGWNGRTLYMIQESHVDYGAQKAIAQILQSLVDQKSLRLILVEGGWRDVSLSYLRNYANEASRVRIAEDFLKQGKISGEEYLNITSDASLLLWGIEEEALYRQNLNAFISLEQKRASIEEALKHTDAVLAARKKEIFTSELLEFDQRRQAYSAQGISILEYVSFLKKWPGFQAAPAGVLESVLHFSGSSDFNIEKAQKAVEDSLAKITKKLSKLETEDLRDLSQKKTVEDQVELIDTLLNLFVSHPKLAKAKTVALLTDYRQMLQQMSELDYGRLLQELAGVEGNILEALKPSELQKEMLALSSYHELLHKLFGIQLSKPEFERLNAEYQNWPIERWNRILQQKSDSKSLSILQENSPIARAFYQEAFAREEALIRNTDEKMKSSPDSIAAVITGGFHSEVMMKSLHQKGYTVIRISPRFELGDTKTDQEKYFRVLKHSFPHEDKS